MKACGNSQNGMRRIIKGNSSTSSGCMATTYILRCADNKLYVGSTTNIKERIKRHNAGYASEFTHLHRPVELVYKEDYDTYHSADSTALERDFGFTPKITLREGLRKFAQWYKSYYKP